WPQRFLRNLSPWEALPNGRQPLGMLSQLTLDRIKIHALQLLGNRPTLASANGTAVQLADWQYFSGRTREESFFCNVNFITGNATLFHLQAKILGEVDDGGAGYAFQTGGKLRSVQNTVRSEEHTSELQSRENLVCRLLLEKKKNKT